MYRPSADWSELCRAVKSAARADVRIAAATLASSHTAGPIQPKASPNPNSGPHQDMPVDQRSASEPQIELSVLDDATDAMGHADPGPETADSRVKFADPRATTPPVYMPHRGTALSIVYLSVFIDMIGVSIILPVIPFLAIEFKASAFELGLLFSAYAGAQMIANLTTGRLSDRVGRKPVIMVSLAGSALGFMLQGFADSYGFYVAARLVSGLFGPPSRRFAPRSPRNPARVPTPQPVAPPWSRRTSRT